MLKALSCLINNIKNVIVFLYGHRVCHFDSRIVFIKCFFLNLYSYDSQLIAKLSREQFKCTVMLPVKCDETIKAFPVPSIHH